MLQIKGNRVSDVEKLRITKEFLRIVSGSSTFESDLLSRIIIDTFPLPFEEWKEKTLTIEMLEQKNLYYQTIDGMKNPNMYLKLIGRVFKHFGMKNLIIDEEKFAAMILKLLENGSSEIPKDYLQMFCKTDKELVSMCSNVLYLYKLEYGIVKLDIQESKQKKKIKPNKASQQLPKVVVSKSPVQKGENKEKPESLQKSCTDEELSQQVEEERNNTSDGSLEENITPLISECYVANPNVEKNCYEPLEDVLEHFINRPSLEEISSILTKLTYLEQNAQKQEEKQKKMKEKQKKMKEEQKKMMKELLKDEMEELKKEMEEKQKKMKEELLKEMEELLKDEMEELKKEMEEKQKKMMKEQRKEMEELKKEMEEKQKKMKEELLKEMEELLKDEKPEMEMVKEELKKMKEMMEKQKKKNKEKQKKMKEEKRKEMEEQRENNLFLLKEIARLSDERRKKVQL